MNAQEEFWAGEFGNEYNKRSPGNVASNIAFFDRALHRVRHRFIPSIVELGAGTGANLQALQFRTPGVQLTAVEINKDAADAIARDCPFVKLHRSSILEWRPIEHELAFTKGVLIHIAPEDLPNAYATLVQASHRWILIAEYYNPKPVEVPYRGHTARLWKRDFAGEMLDAYPALRLVDYGFVYHLDDFPQDDLNWFLFEKRGDHAEAARSAAA